MLRSYKIIYFGVWQPNAALQKVRENIIISYVMALFRVKKTGLDKMAMLCIFALSLLLARIVIISKSAVNLGVPVELEYSGLNVSLPAGTDWQGMGQWRYDDNDFILSAAFRAGSGQVVAWAEWRYLLVPEETSFEEQIQKHAQSFGGEIIETGQIHAEEIIIRWAAIRKPASAYDLFYGTVRLPNNRQLNLQVEYQVGFDDMSERIFRAMARSLEFKDNNLLRKGVEVLNRVKSEGLDTFFSKYAAQEFFLISNQADQIIGFFVSARTELPDKDGFRIANFLYIEKGAGINQATLYESDYWLNGFVWHNRITDLASGKEITSRVQLAEEAVTVSNSGSAIDKTYPVTDSVVPNTMLWPVINAFLDSGAQQVMVDSVTSFGRVVPALISRVDERQLFSQVDGAAYLVRVEFLDRQDEFEQIYLDYDKRIIREETTLGEPLILEQSSAEELLRHFPMRRDYILNLKDI